ncbi:hypothetical protein BH18THE2_BH18THE2_17930 [soil metagenome]
MKGQCLLNLGRLAARHIVIMLRTLSKMNPAVIRVLNKIVYRVNFSNKTRSIKGGQFRLFSANFRSLIEPCRAVE